MTRQKLIKWSILAGKLAVLTLLVWFVHGTVQKAIEDLKRHPRHIAWPWLIVSGFFYCLSQLPPGEFWYRLVRDAGQSLSRYAGWRAFLVSQVGKYVPGKAMVLVLRAGLVRPMQVPTMLVTVTVVLETLTNMAAGSLMAFLILLPQLADRWDLPAAAGAMFLITGLPIIPRLFKFGLRVSGLVKLNPVAIKQLDQISHRTILVGWLTMAGGWWLQGLSLWAVLRSLGAVEGSPLENWPLHTAVAAMSVVAGFLALIPGGLLVREIVIVELFKVAVGADGQPIYGDADVVVSAVLLRLVSVVSDGLISIILYLIRPSPSVPASRGGAEPPEAGTNR